LRFCLFGDEGGGDARNEDSPTEMVLGTEEIFLPLQGQRQLGRKLRQESDPHLVTASDLGAWLDLG
jgi:hypothetical protein